VSIQNYLEKAGDQLEPEGTAEPYGCVQRNKIIKLESQATKIELDIDRRS
jgi:hypothetical protein